MIKYSYGYFAAQAVVIESDLGVSIFEMLEAADALTGGNSLSTTITQLISTVGTNIVMVVLNTVYFKKRKHLFIR